MELLGDLERGVATLIYPNRVLVAIVLLAGLVVIAAVAGRRRWDHTLRRHPRATTAAAIAVVAVGGPIAWYLGSPVVLSRTIDEPAPVVGAVATASPAPVAVTPAPTSMPTAAPTAEPTVVVTPAPIPSPTPVARAGTFAGAEDFHFGRGTARLIETARGTHVVRLEDFAVRTAPTCSSTCHGPRTATPTTRSSSGG